MKAAIYARYSSENQRPRALLIRSTLAESMPPSTSGQWMTTISFQTKPFLVPGKTEWVFMR